jgi:hypothetical protein
MHYLKYIAYSKRLYLISLLFATGLTQAYGHFVLQPNHLDYQDTENFGLPALAVKEFVVHQTGEWDVYQTHQMPIITTFENFIYVFWKKNIRDESKPDGRIVYSRSMDGANWSTPTVVVSSEMLTDDPTRIPTAPAVFNQNGRLHLLAGLHHNEVFLLSSEDGSHWTDPSPLANLSAYAAPSQLSSGRWLWLGQGPRLSARDWERNLWALTSEENPTLPEAWSKATIMDNNPSIRGRWVEPTHFIRPVDNAIVAVTRPGPNAETLFAGVSLDEGRTFSKTSTNFPDAMSRPAAGNLPDGQVYILNNPGKRGDRSILTIALSQDGKVFDRMFALGFNAPPIRWPGYGKPASLRGYQQPQALLWQDSLWIVCSRNKEDIVIFKVSLDNLN